MAILGQEVTSLLGVGHIFAWNARAVGPLLCLMKLPSFWYTPKDAVPFFLGQGLFQFRCSVAAILQKQLLTSLTLVLPHLGTNSNMFQPELQWVANLRPGIRANFPKPLELRNKLNVYLHMPGSIPNGKGNRAAQEFRP